MANVVWAELGKAVMDELGSIIFAAGNPDEFRQVNRSQRFPTSLLNFVPFNSTMKPLRPSSDPLSISPLLSNPFPLCEHIQCTARSSGDGSCLFIFSFAGKKS